MKKLALVVVLLALVRLHRHPRNHRQPKSLHQRLPAWRHLPFRAGQPLRQINSPAFNKKCPSVKEGHFCFAEKNAADSFKI